MNRESSDHLGFPANLTLMSNSAMYQRFASLRSTEFVHRAMNIVLPTIVGLVLGAIVLVINQLPSKWAGLAVIAIIAPVVVLLVGDVKKIFLIVLVVDLPLGLDIVLGEHPGHIGAPAGYMVSLMTMVLVAGYAFWVIDRPAASEKPITYTHKDITIPALTFLFTVLLSSFQAVNLRLSIAELFLLSQIFLMYFYVINHVRTWANVRLIVTTLVVCLLLESILMVFQYTIGFEFSALSIRTQTLEMNTESFAGTRVAGTIGSPNGAATYLAVSLIITFAAYLTNGRLANKKLALAALVVGTAALLATASRSGWIAFLVGALIVVGQALRRGIGHRAFFLLLVGAVLIGSVFFDEIILRFTGDDNYSAISRIWQTKMAFNIIKAHPFTGIGANNLDQVMHKYLPLELMGARYLYIVHNKYLLVWTETGLFGFLSFLWLLLSAIKRGVQSLTRAKDSYVSITITGLLAALVGYSMHMMSDPFASRPRVQPLWFIIALITAISQLAKETDQDNDPIVQMEGKREPAQTNL